MSKKEEKPKKIYKTKKINEINEKVEQDLLKECDFLPNVDKIDDWITIDGHDNKKYLKLKDVPQIEILFTEELQNYAKKVKEDGNIPEDKKTNTYQMLKYSDDKQTIISYTTMGLRYKIINDITYNGSILAKFEDRTKVKCKVMDYYFSKEGELSRAVLNHFKDMYECSKPIKSSKLSRSKSKINNNIFDDYLDVLNELCINDTEQKYYIHRLIGTESKKEFILGSYTKYKQMNVAKLVDRYCLESFDKDKVKITVEEIEVKHELYGLLTVDQQIDNKDNKNIINKHFNLINKGSTKEEIRKRIYLLLQKEQMMDIYKDVRKEKQGYVGCMDFGDSKFVFTGYGDRFIDVICKYYTKVTVDKKYQKLFDKLISKKASEIKIYLYERDIETDMLKDRKYFYMNTINKNGLLNIKDYIDMKKLKGEMTSTMFSLAYRRK